MSSRQVVKINIDNINPYTWYWMIKDIPEDVISCDSHAVIRRCFMECDELVVQKWRSTQQFFKLTFPQHMEYAK
jgi:hypothetical protein